MAKVPAEVDVLIARIVAELPRLLRANVVGIYQFGSLTQGAFDVSKSDVDLLIVLRRRMNEREFERLGKWLACEADRNPWVARLELWFWLQAQLLQVVDSKDSAMFHFMRLKRTGSDGNPIVWLNVLRTGRTLYGADPRTLAPVVNKEQIHAALKREVGYLKEELLVPGSKWRDVASYRAYAVLTLCRIAYTLAAGEVTSKPRAAAWMRKHSPQFAALIDRARGHDKSDDRRGLPLAELRRMLRTVELEVAAPKL